jgi:small subunit ribosomal protein S7
MHLFYLKKKINFINKKNESFNLFLNKVKVFPLAKKVILSKKILKLLFQHNCLKVKTSNELLNLTFKQAFFKERVTPYILVYFKKILNLFLSASFLFLKRLKYIKDKNFDKSFFIYKSPFSKKKILMLKHFLYLIKIKMYNKKFFLLKRKCFIYFLKNKKFLKGYSPQLYIKKFLSSLLSIKSVILTKQNINLFKKSILKTYSKDKKSNALLLYQKLIGVITKKGKKNVATELLNNSLKHLKKELKWSTNFILLKILNRLKVSIEAKKVRIKQSLHLLPFPVKLKRKIFLIAKWLTLGAKKQKLKKSFDFKLKVELNKLICSKDSFSYKYKKYNVYKSLQNRANIHFRW